MVRLAAIKTIASTLGALAVTPAVLQGAVDVQSCVVSDAEAVDACLRFAADQRVLVEPACGAALAAVYGVAQRSKHLAAANRICVIACGGSAVSLELLDGWKRTFGL